MVTNKDKISNRLAGDEWRNFDVKHELCDVKSDSGCILFEFVT